MRALVLGLLLALGGCALQPVYSSGERGAAASLLGSVEVMPIENEAGYLVRERLLQRLRPGAAPRYRLQVVLKDDISGFGVRGDNSIIRERRTLSARYRLLAADGGRVLLDSSESVDSGIDVVSSEYAVVAAENTALERLSEQLADAIVMRLALYGRHNGAGADNAGADRGGGRAAAGGGS